MVVCTDRVHRFGTDAFALAGFARCGPGDTVCDLGSGCGIIPLLLLGGPTPPAEVYGLELQPAAVELMRCAVETNGLAGRFVPVQGDLRCPPEGFPRARADLVVCNPPYFRPGEGFDSPVEGRRLARHEYGFTLEDLCASAAKMLRYGGRLALCHRPWRLCDLMCAMRAAGLEPKRLRMVQQRAASAPWLVLCEGRLGGAPGLEVLPPLVIEHPRGGFSDEMLALYGKQHRLTPPERRGR